MPADETRPGAAGDRPSPRTRLLQRVRARALANDVPLSAFLELTDRCNLRCRHCYIPAPAAAGELSLAEYVRLFDELAAAGTLFLTFTGGEPLLRPDLFPILSAARARSFSFILYTNGTLLTPEACDRLRDLCPQQVEISLLGGRAATHDGLTRVAGSFEQAVRGARLLRERGVQVQFKTTWMRANIDEADEIAALVRDVGARFRSAFLLLHRRDGSAEPEQLGVTEEQLRRAALRRLAAAGDPAVPPAPVLPDEAKKDASPCGAGQTSCRIGARGEVYPCAGLDMLLGNIRRAPFAAIWRDNAVMAKLRAIRVSDLAECRDCPLLLRCSRCPALVRMETGSLLRASAQSCRVTKAFEHVYEERRCELQ